jgi:hypothetical protein
MVWQTTMVINYIQQMNAHKKHPVTAMECTTRRVRTQKGKKNTWYSLIRKGTRKKMTGKNM